MKNGIGCGGITLIAVGLLILTMIIAGAGSSSSKSTSTSTYQYGTRESYDSKYGQGAYDSDKQLLDSMRQQYNNQTGK